jgi:hypothetical protein
MVRHWLLSGERLIKAHVLGDHVILSETKDLAALWLLPLCKDSLSCVPPPTALERRNCKAERDLAGIAKSA